MEKKTYRLTADIGDKKRGETIPLTDEKAASPLYASRIAPVESGAGLEAVVVDVETIRAEVLKELEAEAKQLIADAQAEAKKIVEAAQAEAMKLAAGNGKT